MTRISAEVTGILNFKARLKEIQSRLDPESLLDEVSAILLDRTRKRFLQAVDPEGVPWQISQASLRRSAGKTLYKSGRLFRSIRVYNKSPGVRSIGADVGYGEKHQLGLEGLPKRVFLGFSAEDEQVAINFLRDQIAKAVNA